jgi:colanic acid/amylovoran biosynthesis glycosyltransferase
MEPASFPYCERTKQPGSLRLVQVATITEKKGYWDTLQALNLARKHCPGLHLTIAGEPYDKYLVEKMRDFIRINQLEPWVTWLDFIPHRRLPEFFQNFDVFIHPSCYSANRDCEGGPVVILEAQATGMPVISTTHFDIPSEVLHAETGLLAAENDPVTLSEYICRFYDMKNSEYQQFSRNARRHVEQNFDVKIAAQKLRTLYTGIVYNS